MDIFKNVQKKNFENTFVTIFLKKRENHTFYYPKTSDPLKKIKGSNSPRVEKNKKNRKSGYPPD